MNKMELRLAGSGGQGVILATVILAEVDLNLLRKLGVHVTCEPVYQTKKLYHK